MSHTILIIEDDRLVAKTLKDLFRRCGFHVLFAPDGNSACKLAENNNFDLIISDIRMPGVVGTEVVKKINSTRVRPIPFIFITGYSDECYINEAEKMGCCGFFLKPFDIDAIIRKVEKALGMHISIDNKPTIQGQAPPSRLKKLFYSALGSQWNPEKEIDWNSDLGLADGANKAISRILSPIVMGEYSAFNGLPQRILSFKDQEVKQYLAVQLVDETRHSEAFDLYLVRIKGAEECRKGMRNIHALRFFNGLKKLQDNDQWITGLYLTEILAHALLTSYAEKTDCKLTQHLFKMILSDEGRHISFSSHYLKEILKNASGSDRKYMTDIANHTLKLTEAMIHSYDEYYRLFGLEPSELFEKIKREVELRLIKNIVNVYDEG